MRRKDFGARRSRAHVRVRVCVCLVLSALVHAALLGWATLTVPEAGRATDGFVRSGPALAAPIERVVEVVRIQPPGVLPSGGSAASNAGTATTGVPSVAESAPPAAVPVRLPLAVAAGAPAGSAAFLTFAALPESPLSLPAVGQPGTEARPANRGIVRRRPESRPFSGHGDGWRSTGTTGAGRGFGGGGVTNTGPGTDCITAGLQHPREGIGIGRMSGGRRMGGAPGR